MPELHESAYAGMSILQICPASIWLLGAVANCSKGKGHDGSHKIIIEWTTNGSDDA